MDPARKLLQSTTDPTTFDGGISSSSDPILNISTSKRPLTSNTPFDSSMALTILVLLTALFFIGFFSAYLRRFSDNHNNHTTTNHPSSHPTRKRGLDPSKISSLPVVAYGKSPTTAKHNRMMIEIDDCPICLNEFEETERVKVIPYCGHVFHPSCVDTWLTAHVTCPLCRSAQLFGNKPPQACLDVGKEDKTHGGDADTWRDVECGCSRVADPAVEQTSTGL